MIPPNEASQEAPTLDAAVKRTLVENHRAFLSFLERRVGRRDLAEDILQSAFAKSLEKQELLPPEEALIPWFYRTLRNATIDYWRRSQTASRALEQFSKELEAHHNAPEPIRGEACRCILALAETIKPEYAEALKRIEVDGLSVGDFAAEIGISKNNAGVRVFRAREALKQKLVLSCGSCAEHGCLNCTCSKARAADEPPGAETST